MRNKIYGRKAGTQGEMILLSESDGASNSNTAKSVAPGVLAEFVLANARRAVQMFRDKNIEGYIQFENDPLRYGFTPSEDFEYPAASFPLDELNPGWVKGWGVVRNSPWDLAGMYLTKALADGEQLARGPDYVVGFGSRKLGSNDFIFD